MPSGRNRTGIRHAFKRRAPSHPTCEVRPEILEWLKEQVEGRYWFMYSAHEFSPQVVAEELEFVVWFSRVEDAIKFKLSF